jgi:hypothetical protein
MDLKEKWFIKWYQNKRERREEDTADTVMSQCLEF